jgi:phosphate transport system substrate-binding protein
MKSVAIDSGKGPVAPSEQTVINGTYQPLSRPIFIYVNAKSAKKPEVKQFVEFYMNNAPKLVKEVQYVPLPVQAYKTALGHFQKGRIGTVFGGKEQVGLTIAELMKREAKE